MKTLIINGSPNREGETCSMIKYITKRLKGEFKIIDTYYTDIAPCNACGGCYSSNKCTINDGMTEIYNYMRECDRLIFASPLYFSQFTGSFLSFMSRIQLFSSQKYIRGLDVDIKQKKGLVILNGGGSTINTVGVEQCSRILMRELNCTDFKTVCYIGTDKKRAIEDDNTLKSLELGTEFLNKA